jgi:hypothetical protein
MQNRPIAACATLACLALAAVTGPLAPEARAQQEWVTFTSEDGRFSVTVPVHPVKTETHQKSFIGEVTNHIFTSESEPDSFTVDYSDIPHFALDFAGTDTVYEHAKGALLKKTYGKPTTYEDTKVGGHEAKRLVYDTPTKPGHVEMRGDAVLVLVGDRLYVIDAVVPEAQADVKSERFLSSIEILE